ncbi:MAG: transposase family protein, partial [Pseudomonadota bacterium]
RALRNETANEVTEHFEQIFREHGIPSEVLCDNGPCFQSQVFVTMLEQWGVKVIFRCALQEME